MRAPAVPQGEEQLDKRPVVGDEPPVRQLGEDFGFIRPLDRLHLALLQRQRGQIHICDEGVDVVKAHIEGDGQLGLLVRQVDGEADFLQGFTLGSRAGGVPRDGAAAD